MGPNKSAGNPDRPCLQRKLAFPCSGVETLNSFPVSEKRPQRRRHVRLCKWVGTTVTLQDCNSLPIIRAMDFARILRAGRIFQRKFCTAIGKLRDRFTFRTIFHENVSGQADCLLHASIRIQSALKPIPQQLAHNSAHKNAVSSSNIFSAWALNEIYVNRYAIVCET